MKVYGLIEDGKLENFGMSLGAIGDFLWKNMSELRPELTRIVCEELELASDHDIEDLILPQIELCGLVYEFLLAPGLMQRRIDLIERAMDMVEYVLGLGQVPHGVYADALFHGIIDKITDDADRGMIREACPDTYQRLEAAYASFSSK